MRQHPTVSFFSSLIVLALLPEQGKAQERPVLGYPWLANSSRDSVERRIPPPKGYRRGPLPPDTFGGWLRGLPLKPGNPPVHFFNGGLKKNQSAHFAVIDIDVGDTDLQQCADAVMRLRGEFLYAGNRADQICFPLTNGDIASWARWRDGFRPCAPQFRHAPELEASSRVAECPCATENLLRGVEIRRPYFGAELAALRAHRDFDMLTRDPIGIIRRHRLSGAPELTPRVVAVQKARQSFRGEGWKGSKLERSSVES